MKCTRCGSDARITVTEIRRGRVSDWQLCERCAAAQDPAYVKKAFYSLAEAQQILGKNETAVRRLVRSGKLSEFRHSGRMMLMAGQVDRLKR